MVFFPNQQFHSTSIMHTVQLKFARAPPIFKHKNFVLFY